MKNFKEWLSDHLRYFMLILAAALLFAVIWIGLKVYQNYDSPTSGQSIEILKESGQQKGGASTEALTEAETQTDTAAGETETEKESESETEAAQTQSDAGSLNSQTQADADAGQTNAADSSDQAQAGTTGTDGSQINAADTDGSQTDAVNADSSQNGAAVQPETQPPTEAETQPQTEPQPVYKTMIEACNFRSGPGYEYEVMAVYPAGTTVEFLGIVEGWCEVRIDGVVGYMGQRFFEW